MKKKRSLHISVREMPPLAANRESPCAAMRTQYSQKGKKKSYAAANIYSGCVDSDSYLIGIAQIFKL